MPETMHRKHQVNQLLTDQVHQSNCWRRLSNGQIACLVCPHRPVLDTFPMFIIHRQGKKHEAAALEQEKKDLRHRNEVQKRTAIEANKATDTSQKSTRKREATRKRPRLELTTPEESKITNTATDVSKTKQKIGHAPICPMKTPIDLPPICPVKTSTAIPPICPVKISTAIRQKKLDKGRKESEPKTLSKEDEDRERLLRLREAGWRLDGNGKWLKDESAEFDSDEEAPEDLA